MLFKNISMLLFDLFAVFVVLLGHKFPWALLACYREQKVDLNLFIFFSRAQTGHKLIHPKQWHIQVLHFEA